MSRTDELSPAADGARARGDRPAPYSHADLQERLERLPPGHPSSNYNADGSRRPPPPRLRDLELPPPGDSAFGDSAPGDGSPVDGSPGDGSAGEGSAAGQPSPRDRSGAPQPPGPLTDAEHADHIRRVEQGLD